LTHLRVRMTLISDCYTKLLRKNRRPNCPCVVGLTMVTFLPDYVENNLSSVITVITQNPHLLIPKILRHYSFFNLLVYSPPDSSHVNTGLGTYRAAIIIVPYHLVIALTVHGMPTFHYSSVFQRVEEILVTYRTIMPHGILHT